MAGDIVDAPRYDRKYVGKTLQAARRAAGLTQEQASELAGCSNRHLVQVEGGTTGLSIDLLLALCSIYHITPNDALKAIAPDSDSDRDEVPLLSAYRKLSKRQRKTACAILTALVRDEKEWACD